MPSIDQHRITEQRQHSRIVTLWRYLQSLQSVVSFMNTGAHPDDETSAMLAALGFRDGLSISYACANRGEGGQNDIGSQVTYDLGVVRTAEMEKAAQVLHMRLYWLAENIEDSIFDFGFSKSGVETLGKWGHQRTLSRFVDIVRRERPDLVCPTFLDIPGQHGHHRAMTQLAHEVFDAAADAHFTGSSLPPWQIKKLYLPAWSGAGDAYDDDLPPPPATLVIQGSGEELPSGWTWAQIGQHSRACHKTQGMGRWVGLTQKTDWPLHLAKSTVAGPDTSITAGIPNSLAALASACGSADLEAALRSAGAACTDAVKSWTDYARVTDQASKALHWVRKAQSLASARWLDEHGHRLASKVEQLSHVIRLASGAEVRAVAELDRVAPGDSFEILLETRGADASSSLLIPENWTVAGQTVTVPADATPSDAYPDYYNPASAIAPAVELSVKHNNIVSTTSHTLQVTPVVLPSHRVALTPEQHVLNIASGQRALEVGFKDVRPAGAETEIELPALWASEKTSDGFRLRAPETLNPGLLELPLRVAGQPAHTVTFADYPHTDLRARCYPSVLRVRVIDVQLPEAKIAYIGGGNDRIAHWLRAMGNDVTELDDEMLNHHALEQFDTIVVGLFAIRTRPALINAMPVVHDWIDQGGHLLTLYHRPWDAWDPRRVPPRPLTIGKPSLRWRVTDENAMVTHVLPEHTLLNTPNRISPEDWKGWHKERGLYFAMAWDEAYEALLSMQDPDEEPHVGSLLSARVGRGRHTHTSLILHHQLEKLVPGAFRLMANLVSPVTTR